MKNIDYFLGIFCVCGCVEAMERSFNFIFLATKIFFLRGYALQPSLLTPRFLDAPRTKLTPCLQIFSELITSPAAPTQDRYLHLSLFSLLFFSVRFVLSCFYYYFILFQKCFLFSFFLFFALLIYLFNLLFQNICIGGENSAYTFI